MVADYFRRSHLISFGTKDLFDSSNPFGRSLYRESAGQWLALAIAKTRPGAGINRLYCQQ